VRRFLYEGGAEVLSLNEEICVSLDQLFALGLYGFVCFVALTFTWKRYRWRRRGRGFCPTEAMLGNALHQLQTIAEPQIQYVIEEKLDEELEDDDSCGADDPVRHLHRQAQKIRRGLPIDHLTTFIK
jgi:hypothetical protein